MPTKRPPKKPELLSAWMQYQLKVNRSSFAQVARKLGVTREAVRKSVATPSDRVAEALAAEIGMAKRDIWPDRYHA